MAEPETAAQARAEQARLRAHLAELEQQKALAAYALPDAPSKAERAAFDDLRTQCEITADKIRFLDTEIPRIEAEERRQAAAARRAAFERAKKEALEALDEEQREAEVLATMLGALLPQVEKLSELHGARVRPLYGLVSDHARSTIAGTSLTPLTDPVKVAIHHGDVWPTEKGIADVRATADAIRRQLQRLTLAE